jgi:hypothetical protein
MEAIGPQRVYSFDHVASLLFLISLVLDRESANDPIANLTNLPTRPGYS